jgi:Protein of unknown function (DUF1064)
MAWKLRGNKYGAQKAKGYTSGRLYDSTAERDRAEILRELEREGKISDLREQVTVELEPGVRYKPDFDYIEAGRRVYEDVKGVVTERFRLIMALWRLHGKGPLRVTQRARYGGKFCVTKTILPKDME